MAALKYRIVLSEQEQISLHKRIRSGQDGARVLMRARILLKAHEGICETEIAEALEVSTRTVEKVRQRFYQEGLDRAMYEKPRPGGKRKFDGKQEAHFIALACSTPPDGREHWTLKLLADKVVQLELAESVSPETIRLVLKKRSQAMAKRGVVHSRGEQRICGEDGGGAGLVWGTVRCEPPRHLHGRKSPITD